LFPGFVDVLLVVASPDFIIDTELGGPQLEVLEVKAFVPVPSRGPPLVQTKCESEAFSERSDHYRNTLRRI